MCLGRFDDSVIEERRQCSEDLLQFSANIPALYGSQYIQDFFKVCVFTVGRDPQKKILSCLSGNRIEARKSNQRKACVVCVQGGEVQDCSELIGPAEPFSDFLADSLSVGSAEGEFSVYI